MNNIRKFLSHLDIIRHYRNWRFGFDERDLWSLDYAFFKWLLPRAIQFRKEYNGVPYCNPAKEGVDGFDTEKWEEILDEIIWFLRYMVEEEDWPFKSDPEYKRVMKGYGLLFKWLPTMWT